MLRLFNVVGAALKLSHFRGKIFDKWSENALLTNSFASVYFWHAKWLCTVEGFLISAKSLCTHEKHG